jgi:TolA-binding protein
MVVSTHLNKMRRAGYVVRLAYLLVPAFWLLTACGCLTDKATTMPDTPSPPTETTTPTAAKEPSWTDKIIFWKKADPNVPQTPTADTVVLLAGGEMAKDKTLPVYGGDYEGACRLFQDKEYAKAEPIFERIAETKKNTFQIMEIARYYQAECLYRRRHFPQAADNYILLLNEHPSAAKGREARERLFAIANYWLDETRDEIAASKEKEAATRWFAMPELPFQVHMFDETKPTFDIEGRAIKALEEVYMTDPRGELGERALFLIGSVKFFRQEYKDADHYFFQLAQNYPNGKYTTQALQLSIACKHMATYGPDYDGRRLQEARDLITKVRNSYPELAKASEKFLIREEVEIHQLEAERDYNMAKFWDRTGHPGSAYFEYAIVQHRYPGTEWAAKATKRMGELKERAEEEQRRDPSSAPAVSNEPGPTPRVLVPGTPLQPPPGTLPPGMTGDDKVSR